MGDTEVHHESIAAPVMEDAAQANKIGGLKVHDTGIAVHKRIAARVMGTQATKMGDGQTGD